MRRLSLLFVALLFSGCAASKAERLHVIATPLLIAASDAQRPGVYETGDVSIAAESVLQPMPSLSLEFSQDVTSRVSHTLIPGPLVGMEAQVIEAPREPFTMTAYLEGCPPIVWRYLPSPEDRGLKRLTLVFKRTE